MKYKHTYANPNAIEEAIAPRNDLKALLQANRLKQGLSIQEVADRLGTSRSTVWRWETGKRKPSYEFMVKLQEMGLLP